MTHDQIKDLVSWLVNMGATSVKVGEVAAVFPKPTPIATTTGTVSVEAAKSAFVDKDKNPFGHDLGIEDKILLRSV